MIVNGHRLLKLAPIKHMKVTKERLHGVSNGLAEAGYDIRIKQTVIFYPAGSIISEGNVDPYRTNEDVIFVDDVGFLTRHGNSRFVLASAIEEFDMPTSLLGVVHDKSTWARQGLSVFNTVIEPGFKGFLTLELVFHGNKPITIKAGSGIAQVLFHDVVVAAQYKGKYQNQENRPVDSVFSGS